MWGCASVCEEVHTYMCVYVETRVQPWGPGHSSVTRRPIKLFQVYCWSHDLRRIWGLMIWEGSISLCVFVSVCLSVYIMTSLHVCLPIYYLSVCLFFCLSSIICNLCLFICLSKLYCLSSIHPSISNLFMFIYVPIVYHVSAAHYFPTVCQLSMNHLYMDLWFSLLVL